MSVGDVFLVITPDAKCGEWPLGKVTETYPGKDGLFRVVKLLVGKSKLTRPITKICPLEWDERVARRNRQCDADQPPNTSRRRRMS